MDKKTENELNKALQAKMQEVRDSALLAGSKAIGELNGKDNYFT